MALGRKSWLFAGSDRGGQRAAFMYSLIVTARMNGVDAGPTCLSDAELATFRRLDQAYALPFPLATGDAGLPGFNVFTADTGRPPASSTQGLVTMFGFGTTQPATPVVKGMSFAALIGEQVVQYVLTQDPTFDPLKFDIDHLERFEAHMRESSQADTADLVMDGFARKGGKLLILQGTDDMQVSPRATEAYYAQLRKSLGPAALERVARYYEVPGFAVTIR